MNRWVKVGAISIALIIVVFTSLGAGILIGTTGFGIFAGSPPNDVEPDEFRIFWQAWDTVHKNFVDRAALDDQELTYGAIRGMVQALGDEGHTAFLTAAERERQQTELSGTFSGIGAQLGVRDQLPVIVAPFDGSPADQAGVKAGDIILAVDGEDVTSLPLNDIVNKIRGPEGTDVTLSLLRPDGSRSVEVTITRGEIKVPAASWAMIPGTSVALIRLSQFTANAEQDVVKSLKEAKEAGATSMILDVRNNPGGLLEQAINVTSQFLTGGDVLLEEDANGNRKAYAVKPGGEGTELPMVVLINGGSASSSEILAGAIQDHDRGELVGQTTFGTGTVLQPFILEDGSALLVGTRQWLTPKGRLIRKQGISPDYEVTLPIEADLLTPEEIKDLDASEVLASEDSQLLKALELLGVSLTKAK
ncbi:MAG: S41 family peptidase [Caldilineaceae bacterium]|nr:S41 family peptidase [Caldilineaceae bacterium]